MVNKRRQRKSKLPKLVDPTKDWDVHTSPLRHARHGGWLSKLHGIRCEECSAVNRKMAKFCDQCGTELGI